MSEPTHPGPAYRPPAAPVPGGVYGHPQPPPRKRKAPVWLIVVAAVVLGVCGIGTIAAIASSGTELDEPSTAAAPTTSADAESAPAADKPEPPAQTEPEPEPEPEPELSLEQEQAIVSAQSYLTTVGGFSRSGLIGQLEYEGFSTADAEFAVDYLDVDWREQAVISAESYMENVGGFSRQGLIDQLKYEGFSTKNAEYAADQVGF